MAEHQFRHKTPLAEGGEATRFGRPSSTVASPVPRCD
jgi:hypothetical protein